MNKYLVILLALTLAVGCKQKKDDKKSDVIIEGIETPKERDYTESELIIGRRICNALKTKRELFEKQADQQQQIRFRGENRNCDNIVYNGAEFTASVSNASTNNLQYVASNRTNYLSDVISDQSGVMKIICDNLSVSDTVKNTVLIGSSFMTVNILIASGYDRLEITKRNRDTAGNYTFASLETINVFTQANQINSKFFGLEQERFRYTSCPNPKVNSYIKQNWVTALTSF